MLRNVFRRSRRINLGLTDNGQLPGALPSARSAAVVANKVAAGVVRVSAIGSRSSRSKGDEVIIVGAMTARGSLIDLQRLAGDSFDLMRPVYVASRTPLPVGIKLTAGQSIDLPLGYGGSLHLVSHPWSGNALIETDGQHRALDLFGETSDIIEVDIDGLVPLIAPSDVPLRVSPPLAAFELHEELGRHLARLGRQREALRHVPAADVLAVYTPRWKGVTAATLNLFPCALPIPLMPDQHPEDIDTSAIETIADALCATPFEAIVFSGGDTLFFRLFEACRKRRPRIDIRLLWHSSYMQMGEPHDWNLLMPWLAAAKSKRLRRVGVVKPGMEQFLAAHGVDARFVQNRVPLRNPAMVEPGRPDVVGLWMSGSSDYRKPVVPSLIAIAGLPGVRIRTAGIGELGLRVIDELRIAALTRFAAPIAHADVLANMRQTAASLYVTLSECMPMVPLESMAEGAPCVVGPATELFSDAPDLAERLVVRDPTDPAAIRSRLSAVLDDRANLRARCVDYLEQLNARATRDLAAFLN